MKLWMICAYVIFLSLFQIASANFAIFQVNNPSCWQTGVDGWTVICSTAITTGSCAAGNADGTCRYYVSNSGSNSSNDCLNSASPCQTVAFGLSKMRAGKPDWLLLKCGDSFTESNQLLTSGLSATAPALLSSYLLATPTIPDPASSSCVRPVIKTTAAIGTALFSSGGGGGGSGGSNWAIIGIELYASTRDPASPDYNAGTIGNSIVGISLLNQFTWFLIEDCFVHYFSDNLDITGGAFGPISSNFRLRRNVIADAYMPSVGHSQGLLLQTGIPSTSNPLIEENLFDHNGWNETNTQPSGDYIFNRNIYIVEGTPTITFRGNISARSSSEGAQFRTGGDIFNNLFVQNSQGYSFGVVQDNGATTLFYGVAHHNVTLQSRDIPKGSDPLNISQARGDGISVANTVGPNVTISNDIIAQDESAFAAGYGMSYASDTISTTFSNNIIFNYNASIFIPTFGGLMTTASFGSFTPGSGYTAGTYDPNDDGVALTGGSGTGATAGFVIAGGVITQFIPRKRGQSYTIGNNLGVAAADVGGTGSGFSIPIILVGAASTSTPNCIDLAGTNNNPGGTCPAEPFPNPTRTIGSYAGTIGLTATLNAFLTAARAQSKANWQTNLMACTVNNYIRTGFGQAPAC